VINSVTLLGYLRQAPALSYTPNGTPYTALVIETERTWCDGEGERRTEREVHTIQVWWALAEVCSQYLRENQLVYIAGRLHTHVWEDEQQVKHQRIAVVAEQVKFLPHFHPPAIAAR
jgi:single-strand DNA-binding protein